MAAFQLKDGERLYASLFKVVSIFVLSTTEGNFEKRGALRGGRTLTFARATRHGHRLQTPWPARSQVACSPSR
jgi:hypothetical protein